MAAETPDPSTALPAADVDEPLPLDDLRWAPLDNAGMRLSPHLGGHSIAAHDLSGTLATAGLRCLNRYRAPGGVWVRVRVSFLCWAGYRLAAGSDGKLSIGRRRDWPREGYSELDLKHCGDPRANGQPFSQIGFGQGVLFCWRSDLERIWPGVFVPTSVRTEETETEKTAVPVKPLTPEQKVLIAIIRRKHPNGFSAKPDFSALARWIATQWERECRKQEVVPTKSPGRDTVRRTLRQASLLLYQP